MKALFLLLCPLLLNLGGGAGLPGDLPTFQATVLSLSEDTALVEAIDSDILRSGGQFTFSTAALPDQNIQVGDRVRIVYTGAVQETYPGQIQVIAWGPAACALPLAPLTSREPPALTVTHSGQSLALTGTPDTWSYDPGDGTYLSVVACGAHPLDPSAAWPSLPLVREGSLSLAFTTPPHRVVIRAWDKDNPDGLDQQPTSLTWDGQGFHLPPAAQNLVLEVLATWDQKGPGSSYGTGVYTFALAS